MNDELSGKIAVVTGGTRGIGYAIAEALARAGCSVAICGRNAEDAESAAARIAKTSGQSVLGVKSDVSQLEDVRHLFRTVTQSLGEVDILINNAGAGLFKAIAELSPDEWRRIIDLNLTGAYYCAHEALPGMRKRGSGYIINISSLAGKNAFAGGGAYNASKFGLNGFSEALMLDHRHDGIRVSYIMPGSVDTDFSPRSGRAEWKIQPEDIAEIVLMLLRMPQRTLVSRIEVRPTRPPKSGG